jgi:hypothetical protein
MKWSKNYQKQERKNLYGEYIQLKKTYPKIYFNFEYFVKTHTKYESLGQQTDIKSFFDKVLEKCSIKALTMEEIIASRLNAYTPII